MHGRSVILESTRVVHREKLNGLHHAYKEASWYNLCLKVTAKKDRGGLWLYEKERRAVGVREYDT